MESYFAELNSWWNQNIKFAGKIQKKSKHAKNYREVVLDGTQSEVKVEANVVEGEIDAVVKYAEPVASPPASTQALSPAPKIIIEGNQNENSEDLQEVVVTGYISAPQKSVAYSAQRISSEEITRNSSVDATSALQGKVQE